MKKIVSLCLLCAVSAWIVAPAMACQASDSSADSTDDATSTAPMVTIGTSLTASTGSGSSDADPIVKVKWEMNGPYGSMLGTDDSPAAAAQFNPSGMFQVSKQISLCAVASDPDGLADVDSVYGDVYYPDVRLHQDPNGGGCGAIVGTECRMTKLSKADGLALFCATVRNKNTNLPSFGVGYGYDEICKADGELQKETAAVFCCDKTLSYEDPAGGYKTVVFAQDKFGLNSDPLQNTFTYEAVTSFETDFDKIPYGNVKLNTHKIISGDLSFAAAKNSDGATVRNIGNTRLQLSALEDDMGLGQTGTMWNVTYVARVGNGESDWTNYLPKAKTWLTKSLDLSETNEMDFSVLVSKFPLGTGPNYTGSVILGSRAADPLLCAR